MALSEASPPSYNRSPHQPRDRHDRQSQTPYVMWWGDELIERIVTREFVCNRLIPQEIERLDQPLGFGENLTDDTYWQWIDEKAKKIFLILTDLGLPDQIFGLIDDSWDDEDLPIPLDQIERLALTSYKDEKTEKKFYHRQFRYLLRHLQKGDHLDYEDDELVPLDVIDKKHAPNQNHHIDTVFLPREPGAIFCRHQIPLGPGSFSREQFIREINGIMRYQHEHLLSYWTSYTHQTHGYIIFTPAAEFSLKSLLGTTPSSLKNLDKSVRQQTVMNWIHCLADTVGFLHSQGLSHGHIRPSTVMFSSGHSVFLTGFTRFHAQMQGTMTENHSFDKEAYDYAAPEQWCKSLPSSPTSLHGAADSISSPTSTMFAADIFSLGCVVLELLSFLFKKHGRPFAAHRAAKHKSAGRGGAVLDSSFQRNLGQVDGWMAHLAKEAAKKSKDGAAAAAAVFRGVAPMLRLVEHMLASHPSDRPTAGQVQARMYQILTETCGMPEPHCVHQYGGLLDADMASLRLSSAAPLAGPPPGSPSSTRDPKRGSSSGGSSGGSSIRREQFGPRGGEGKGQSKGLLRRRARQSPSRRPRSVGAVG